MKVQVGTAVLFVTLFGAIPVLGDYAAIYVGETRLDCSYGAAVGETENEAKRDALALCRDAPSGSACQLQQSAGNAQGNRCISVTEPTVRVPEGKKCYSTGSGPTQAAAEQTARSRCQVSCTVGWTYCTVADKPQPGNNPQDQCKPIGPPTKRDDPRWGTCFYASNTVNGRGSPCSYRPDFMSSKTGATSGDVVYPGEDNHRVLCQQAGETLTFVRWVPNG